MFGRKAGLLALQLLLFFSYLELQCKRVSQGVDSKGRNDLYDYTPQTSAGVGLEDELGNPT